MVRYVFFPLMSVPAPIVCRVDTKQKVFVKDGSGAHRNAIAVEPETMNNIVVVRLPTFKIQALSFGVLCNPALC